MAARAVPQTPAASVHVDASPTSEATLLPPPPLCIARAAVSPSSRREVAVLHASVGSTVTLETTPLLLVHTKMTATLAIGRLPPAAATLARSALAKPPALLCMDAPVMPGASSAMPTVETKELATAPPPPLGAAAAATARDTNTAMSTMAMTSSAAHATTRPMRTRRRRAAASACA